MNATPSHSNTRETHGWGKPILIINNLETLEDAQLFVFSTEHFDTASYRLAKGE
jgi:hypothetical protein